MSTTRNLKLVLITFVALLSFPGLSLAGAQCTAPATLIKKTFGTIPYLNGEISYESRNERRGATAVYVWSITDNTTGYVIEAKWGTRTDDDKYLPKIRVKNQPGKPRCRVRSSSKAWEKSQRILSYKRRGTTAWKTDDPETIFESVSSTNIVNNLFSMFSNSLVTNSHAQTTKDTVLLHTLYKAGRLSPQVTKYFSPDTGLAVDSLIQDNAALRDYFASGLSSLRHFSSLISDFPIDDNSARDFNKDRDISSDKMTPVYIYVGTEIRPGRNNRFRLSYVIYAVVLRDGLVKGYDTDAFARMGLSFAPVADGRVGVYFQKAIGESRAAFRTLPAPGKGSRVRIDAGSASSFIARGSGSLLMTLSGTTSPIMDFTLLDPVN